MPLPVAVPARFLVGPVVSLILVVTIAVAISWRRRVVVVVKPLTAGVHPDFLDGMIPEAVVDGPKFWKALGPYFLAKHISTL